MRKLYRNPLYLPTKASHNLQDSGIHNSGNTDGTANGSIKCLKTAVTGRHYAFRLHTAPFTPLRTTGKCVAYFGITANKKKNFINKGQEKTPAFSFAFSYFKVENLRFSPFKPIFVCFFRFLPPTYTSTPLGRRTKNSAQNPPNRLLKTQLQPNACCP